MITTTHIVLRAGMLLAAASLALSGCAANAAPATEPTSATAAALAADAVVIADAWVKAADGGMSAAFGTLTNSSDDDVTIVAAEAAVSPMLELHETVTNGTGEMTMRPVEGGLVIPASGSLALEPGGAHIMLMDLTQPLVAGEEITLTLTLADGSTVEFTAPVKHFAGANENYESDGEMAHR